MAGNLFELIFMDTRNAQRKRHNLVLAVEPEMRERLRRIVAEFPGVTISDVVRYVLDDKLDDLEEAIKRGEKFTIRRPLGILQPVTLEN